jgi:hypothetical protein
MTVSTRVTRNRSGVYYRREAGLGLLVYSPFTGLTYAVHPVALQGVARWLGGRGPNPGPVYAHSIGAGWATPLRDAVQPVPQVLPSREAWRAVEGSRRPILVNWFLTGMCPLACRYCYAEDLMRDRSREPDAIRIEELAHTILSYHPLVVVLTGGDPLVSPHLSRAVELLSGPPGCTRITERGEKGRIKREGEWVARRPAGSHRG